MAGKGRPTLFDKLYVEQAYKLALLGLTDEEIASFFSVCLRTLGNWKSEHPDFLQSMQRGKISSDANVAASLYERACGYSHEDTHFAVIDGKVVQTVHEKHYPPETAAAKMWLTNRQPHLWRNKVEVKREVTDPFPPTEVLDAITAKAMVEIEARREALKKERAELNLDGLEALLEGDLPDE